MYIAVKNLGLLVCTPPAKVEQGSLSAYMFQLSYHKGVVVLIFLGSNVVLLTFLSLALISLFKIPIKFHAKVPSGVPRWQEGCDVPYVC